MNPNIPLRLYNSDGRTTQEFVPLSKDKVGIYCCGPTVYNYAHIGNLRTYLFEDILKRILLLKGYEVTHVMNITDVGHLTDDGDDGEDKMIKSAREKGLSVWDIAEFFTQAFFKDCDALNIIRPTICCKATDHIQDMIKHIQKLEKMGYAYSSGGNIYFDTSQFNSYGKMALLDRQNLIAGQRVDVDSNKKNYADFALWFTESKFENQAMLWDSPWGRGYPGWHIECSAMSMKYLGEQFDIHCGGIDHIPVHHTNEIAQSEALTGKKWVKYWVHGEFLVLDKGKMSKSGGSFITLQTLLDKGYEPLDYRYFCLGAHYRTQLQFSYDSLDQAKSARKSIEKKIINLLKEAKMPCRDISNQDILSLLNQFYEDLFDDMNMPRALSRLHALFKIEADSNEKLAAIYQMDKIFGLGFDTITLDTTSSATLSNEAQALFDARVVARKEKNYGESDRLRDELLKMGIAVKDGPDGSTWSFI